jgi:hypothetical protein
MPKKGKKQSQSARQNGTIGRVGTVGLLTNAQVPRSTMSWSNPRAGVMKIRGVELISELFCHISAEVEKTILLNPMSSQFARLSAISGGFEHFNFRKLRLVYTPGCPATRSGVVMMAYMEDPLSEDPSGAVEFRAYETSSVCSVGVPSQTQVENEDQQRWWLIHPVSEPLDVSSGSSSYVDPSNRFQGKVVVCTAGSSAADDKLLAGYISIEYEVDLSSLRPSRKLMMSLSTMSTSAQSFVRGASLSANTFHWPKLNWEMGDFGWSPDRSERADMGYDMDQTWMLEAGNWILSYLIGLDAASVEQGYEMITIKKDRRVKPKIYSTQRGVRVRNVSNEIISLSPSRVFLLEGSPNNCVKLGVSKTGRALFRLGEVKDGEHCEPYWRHVTLEPEAAGDVTISVIGIDNETFIETTFMTVTAALGTGAITLEDCTSFSTAINPSAYVTRAQVVPTGTETRALDPSPTSKFNLVKVVSAATN